MVHVVKYSPLEIAMFSSYLLELGSPGNLYILLLVRGCPNGRAVKCIANCEETLSYIYTNEIWNLLICFLCFRFLKQQVKSQGSVVLKPDIPGNLRRLLL